MSFQEFDVIVLGGGPGGYISAIRASQLGKKVALVEANHLGGICLNWGCIPTKTLLRASEINHLLHNLDYFGFSAKDIKFDFDKIIARSRQVAEKLSGGIAHLMKKNKVTIFNGYGKLNGKGKVKVIEGQEKIADLAAKNIILATGARARILPGFEPDGKMVFTYKEAMTPKKMPKSVIVVGSGAIGVEFASFYRNLGAEVTIIEMAEQILPVEDADIAKIAHKSFEKQGMKIITNAKVEKLDKTSKDVTITLEKDAKKQQITAEVVIMAVGVVANTENLGLDGTKVKIDRGFIRTDQWCQTDEIGVFAIGDVTSPPWLAHKASHEGVLVAEYIAGVANLHPMKRENIPGCTYCMPQIASVGLTEKAAKEQGKNIKIGKFPFMANGKAIAMGEDEGLVKTIFDAETGELLGAHMIGAEVTEMISSFVLGKTMEATEEDFMHTIFPHPTLSEMMHESVLDAFGKVLNF